MLLAEASGFISFLPQLDPQQIYTYSFWVSVCLFAVFYLFQRYYYIKTKRLVKKYMDFFAKKDDYAFEKADNNSSLEIKNVAKNAAYLHELIDDINEYLSTCKGSASFGIIHNKTERRLTMRYDEATADMSFPTHLGLMGTFVGVFIGLFFFLWASSGADGITDEAIHSLITGVLVSMSTSFVGLYMSIRMTAKASKARTIVDEDKNDFYEFVQNEVMNKVDTSLADALGSLHETVATFEPQFSHVIEGFKTTFEQCTVAFGEDFRKSVALLVSAVNDMGKNMGIVNENVDLLKELIGRMSSGDMVRYMRSFSDAADHIQVVTSSLSDFERARRMMLAAAQESINIQKTYNESLKIPNEVVTKINTILSRITRFEDNINKAGESLDRINMVSDTQVQALQNIINAIREKHKVALDFGNTADSKLEKYFNDEINRLKNMQGQYQAALSEVTKQYIEIFQEQEADIRKRHEDFIKVVNEKFNLDECHDEFANLHRLHEITGVIHHIEDALMKQQQDLRSRLDKIEKAIGNIKVEQKSSSWFGSSSKEEDKKASKNSDKRGTARPYEPPVKPKNEEKKEKSAKELLHEMGLDKEDEHPTVPKRIPTTGGANSGNVSTNEPAKNPEESKPWYKFW